MSAPVTQWFQYDHKNWVTSTPNSRRRGWYDVKRGKSRIKWRGYWNGDRFSRLLCVTPISSCAWWNVILKYPHVTAWRGLADKPATTGDSHEDILEIPRLGMGNVWHRLDA